MWYDLHMKFAIMLADAEEKNIRTTEGIKNSLPHNSVLRGIKIRFLSRSVSRYGAAIKHIQTTMSCRSLREVMTFLLRFAANSFRGCCNALNRSIYALLVQVRYRTLDISLADLWIRTFFPFFLVIAAFILSVWKLEFWFRRCNGTLVSSSSTLVRRPRNSIISEQTRLRH